jgi:uncharacterized protein YndB with AHSA1/START domain
MSTNAIEKVSILRAPRSRVWRAIADSGEFGAWFGVKFDRPFAPGAHMRGQITNPPEYAGTAFTFLVERVEPEHLFSYRWHPYAVDPAVDYSAEPMTLVEFRLDEVPEGTRLTVVESGFDQVPSARRAEALRMNSGGWEAQLANIERFVAG